MWRLKSICIKSTPTDAAVACTVQSTGSPTMGPGSNATYTFNANGTFAESISGSETWTLSNPVRKLVSAIDLQAWLASLSDDDQVLLSMRKAGYRLKPIAKRLVISTSAAWARCRELGYELAEQAHVEVPRGGRQQEN